MILDDQGQTMCRLKGKWTGWEFRFLDADGDTEFAKVSKKWAGLGKEMFTSADNYILQIHDNVPYDHPMRCLILAAIMCIDFVYKER